MTLPEIVLPAIKLPFVIPELIHPITAHFAIVLPVIILLLEFYNLFTRRKSIGGFSFILILLTVLAFALAYLSGGVDGKAAYDFLSPEGQAELKEHKLLGTYLLLGSVVLLFLKLLSMTGKVILKIIFFIGLISFVGMTFNQGKDGGELVYEYGANVEKVKTLDDALFEANDLLEDAQSELEKRTSEVKKTTPLVGSDNKPTLIKKEEKKAKEAVDVLLDSAKKEMQESNSAVIETLREAAKQVLDTPVESAPANIELH